MAPTKRPVGDSSSAPQQLHVILRHTYIAFFTGLLFSFLNLGIILVLFYEPENTAEHLIWTAFVLAAVLPFITGAGGYTLDRCAARERAEASAVTKISEEQSKLHEEYREYLDVTPGVILRSHLNLSGQLVATWVNRRGLELFRMTMEEARGRNIFELIDPKDRPTVEADAHRILFNNAEISSEFHSITPDGRRLTLFSKSVAIRENGKPVGLHTIMSDLTELRAKDAALREERARLERVQRLSHTGSWEYDVETNIITASESVFEIYGLKPTENLQLSLNTIRSIYLEPERSANALVELISHGRPYDIVFEINRHGEHRIIHSVAELLRKENGSPYKVLGSIQDITDRIQLERQLAATQKDRVLNTLAAGIAHDFNNILAAILGNLELIAGDNDSRKPSAPPATNIELLKEIKQATLRGREMTRAILAFARGEPNEPRQPINLSSIISEVVKLLERSINKNISIRQEIAADLFTIDGIPSEIHQVLMNLCVNANEAMPRGGIITIGIRRFVRSNLPEAPRAPSSTEDYIELYIRDTGHGMPPEILNKIFEPFFTTKIRDDSNPERKTGTGLGLATVRNIVERHQGRITVDSQIGVGSVFTILLPKGRLQTEDRKPLQSPTKPSNKHTILIIDDEDPVRIMLKRLLSAAGHVVICAENGIQGSDIFQSNQTIDLVLLDSSMPKLSGEETFHRLKAIRPCKIIMSSGNLDPNTRSRLISLGLQGVLEKPYDKETLFRTLNSLD